MPQATLHLRARDHDLLDALADYRFLSVPQAAALFFPNARSAARRLAALAKARLAVPVYMSVKPWDRRSETVYALGPRGAEFLAPSRNGLRPRHLTSREQRSALFLHHTLARNDLRIAFERLQEVEPSFRLLAWQQVPEQVRLSAVIRVGVRTEARTPAVPDGLALLRVHGQCQVLAVEIDRGTVSIVRMLRRYRAYWKWWRLGGARLRYGPVPFRVVTLAPEGSRLNSLVHAAERAPEVGSQGSRLFWFAPQSVADIARPESLLEPTWRVAHRRATRPEILFAPQPDSSLPTL